MRCIARVGVFCLFWRVPPHWRKHLKSACSFEVECNNKGPIHNEPRCVLMSQSWMLLWNDRLKPLLSQPSCRTPDFMSFGNIWGVPTLGSSTDPVWCCWEKSIRMLVNTEEHAVFWNWFIAGLRWSSLKQEKTHDYMSWLYMALMLISFASVLHITMLWWELQRVNRKKHLSKKRFPFVTVWVLERINPESSRVQLKETIREMKRCKWKRKKKSSKSSFTHLYVISNLHDLFLSVKSVGQDV